MGKKISSYSLFILACLTWSCDKEEPANSLQFSQVEIPADTTAVFPNMYAEGESLFLTWIERSGDKHALFYLEQNMQGIDKKREIAKGSDWFVNWADFPSLSVFPSGALAAHTLEKSGEDTYAYDVNIRTKSSNGEWSKSFVPHHDGTKTEHGFVSMIPLSNGKMGAVWLDGQNYGTEGAAEQMMLAYGEFTETGEVSNTSFIDRRVCDCCQTDITMTEEGPIVVYRDRSDQEIRDVYVSKFKNGTWQSGHPIHPDGWTIKGCPVNGPAITSWEADVAVAWYTQTQDRASVRLAISQDMGNTFSAPIHLDNGSPIGRVDVVISPKQEIFISWIEKGKEGNIMLAEVNIEGEIISKQYVTGINTERASGFPILDIYDDDLYLAFTHEKGIHLLKASL